MHHMQASLPILSPGKRLINISSVASKPANLDPGKVSGASKATLDSMTSLVAAKYVLEKDIAIDSVDSGLSIWTPQGRRCSRAEMY